MKRKVKIPKYQAGNLGTPKRKFGDVPDWYNPSTSLFEQDYFPQSEGVDDIYAEQRNTLNNLRNAYKTTNNVGTKQLIWDFEKDFQDMLEKDSGFAETNTNLVNLNKAQQDLQNYKLSANIGTTHPVNEMNILKNIPYTLPKSTPSIQGQPINNPYQVNQKPLNQTKTTRDFGLNAKNFTGLQTINGIVNGIGNIYNQGQQNQSIRNQNPLSSMQFSNGRSNQSKYGYSFQKGGFKWDNEDDEFLFGDDEETTNVAEQPRTNDEEVINEELQPQVKQKYDWNNDPLDLLQSKKRVIPQYQPIEQVNYNSVQPSQNLSLGNQQTQVYQHLQNKGLTKEAIAGIMGNIQHESNFNSGIPGDNGTSFGLFQHHADRKSNLLNYLNKRGLPANSVQGQIDFALQENPSIVKELNQAKTPQQAADIWVRKFEVPANVDKQSQLRQKASLNYYQKGGTKVNFPKFDPTLIQQKPIIENTNPIKRKPIVQDIWIDPQTGLPMTQQKANLLLAAQKHQNPGKITKTVPRTTKQNIIDVVSNPMTSTKQLINKQPVTGRGERNVYDNALDLVNPVTYVKAIKNTVKNVVHPINTTKKLANAGMGSLEYIVDGRTDRNVGDGYGVILDGLMTAQTVKSATPYLKQAVNNTYKINPWAFKPNPNAYYHRSPNIDNIIKNDKLVGFGNSEAGLKYSAEAGPGGLGNVIPGTKINLRKTAHGVPYFSKGTPLDYGRTTKSISQGYAGPYIAEATNTPFVAKANGKLVKVVDPITKEIKKGVAPNKLGAYAVPEQGYVPLNNVKFYKEHWLYGYKPVKLQKGGINDNNGYLINNLHNFTPKKIINSNYITTQGLAMPIIANGIPLYPNTGDYIFPTNKVVETPMYQEGGYLIKKGDNLTKISKKLGVSINELAKLNNIKDINKIYAGDSLIYDNAIKEVPQSLKPTTPKSLLETPYLPKYTNNTQATPIVKKVIPNVVQNKVINQPILQKNKVKPIINKTVSNSIPFYLQSNKPKEIIRSGLDFLPKEFKQTKITKQPITKNKTLQTVSKTSNKITNPYKVTTSDSYSKNTNKIPLNNTKLKTIDEPSLIEKAQGIWDGINQRFIGSLEKEDNKAIVKKSIPKSKIKFGYKELYTVPDVKGGPKDSLLSSTYTGSNDTGTIFKIGNMVKNLDNPNTSFNNVEGVAHFIMDGDVLPNQKHTENYADARGKIANSNVPNKFINSSSKNPEDYNMYYKKNNQGDYNVVYKQNKYGQPYLNKGWEGDLTVRNVLFSNIDWAGSGPSTGFAAKSSYIPLKDKTGATSIPYKNKSGYSRFSGGSGIYIYKDPITNKEVQTNVSGSPQTLKEIGQSIIDNNKIDPNSLVFLYHDMGSYSAKPKAKPDGTLNYNQWSNFNTYNRGRSGAPLIIPKQQQGGIFMKDPTMEALSNVYTQKNKNLPWVDRGLNPQNYPIQNQQDFMNNGKPMTHQLSWSENRDYTKFYVQPEIDYNQGSLKWNNNQQPIEFNNKKMAEYYSKNGLIKHLTGGIHYVDNATLINLKQKKVKFKYV